MKINIIITVIATMVYIFHKLIAMGLSVVKVKGSVLFSKHKVKGKLINLC